MPLDLRSTTRRAHLRELACWLIAASLPADAQHPTRMPRVAILAVGSPSSFGDYIEAVKAGLRDLGRVEGRNVIFDIQWAMGDLDRLPSLARQLVAMHPDVVWTGATVSALAAQKATATIPIVAAGLSDPIGSGLAKDLARPGGNVTGVSSQSADLSPKQMELLRAIIPTVSRIALLWADSNPRSLLTNLLAAAQASKVSVSVREVKSVADIDAVFLRMSGERVDALLVPSGALFLLNRRRIADLSLQYRIPSVSDRREYVSEGMLLSYGTNLLASYRQSAGHIEKILRGAIPGELPIEQPTVLELVVNARTAKQLGLTIPKSLLLRADEVIE